MEIVASGTLEAFQSSEIYIFGGLKSQCDVKKAHFGYFFLSKYSYFSPILFPILVAVYVYEPFYMVYVMGIVASGTLEAF